MQEVRGGTEKGAGKAARGSARQPPQRQESGNGAEAPPRPEREAGHATTVGQDAEDRAPGSVSERLSGQFGIGSFVPSDLVDIAKDMILRASQQPEPMFRAGLGLISELAKIAVGQSSLAPHPADKRFADPTWRQSWLHKGLLQSYLAWSQAMQQYARNSSADPLEAQRAAFLVSQIIDAMAPTNALLSNPAAMKRFIETGGDSIRRGLGNLLQDAGKGRVIPSQSDDRPFRIGENLAATPGSVVLRTEMFELIHYAPQTPQVYRTPMLFVPALVNKYYVFDLAPGRSLFEHFIRLGVTWFTMVWRNPRPEHDHWGMDDYQEAVDQAIAAVNEITGVEAVNLWGVCGASPTVVSMAAYYAATGQKKIGNLLLLVPLLDLSTLSRTEGIGPFIDQKGGALKKLQSKPGRMSARDFGLLFALLRSNDLIWNYWVSNYLMGDDPPTFDILTWNNDGTGMTAKFNEQFAAMVEENPLVTPGAHHVRGTPIAGLDNLGIDSYAVGAANDHICRWQGVYRAAWMLGERCRFVLGSSGHIQTLVCPPGNPKSSYYTNSARPASADDWLQGATKHAGTWWDDCSAWLKKRSGPQIEAPSTLGSARHPAIGKAPGTYVLEEV